MDKWEALKLYLETQRDRAMERFDKHHDIVDQWSIGIYDAILKIMNDAENIQSLKEAGY